MVTPVGHDLKSTWHGVLNGHSGVAEVSHFDASASPSKICATVKDFDPTAHLSNKEQRKLGLFIQYGVVAAAEAIADSGLEINDNNAHRVGTCLGSGIGGLPTIEENHANLLNNGPKSVSPFFVPGSIINLAPGYLSIKYGLRGPNLTVVTACASGTHAISTAARHIAYGDADIMISGGTEMATSALGMAGFCALKALSKNNDNPTTASRPFDRDRDGFVLGDGAAILVLESYEHAKKRGAKIYAEVAGCGLSSDAYHITSPDPTARSSSYCMQQALKDAGIQAEQIDYISAHATSTKTGDLAEVTAIKNVFGDHAKRLAISATKSMHGHLLGASGALEAGFCALAIRDQIAPPTINLDHPDQGFDLDFIPHHAREMKIDSCLSNSFGFGGTNGCLIIRKAL